MFSMFTTDQFEDMMNRTKFVRWLASTVVVFFAALALAWLAVTVINPGPEGRIVIATGGADNTYHDLARRYATALQEKGIDVELRPSLEGIDALKAIMDPHSGVDAAFVKGGFASTLQGRLASVKARDWHDNQLPKVRSLGRLFSEPIFVFVRADMTVATLRDLANKRIYVDTRASGARRIATQLLKANGVEAPDPAAKPATKGNATIIEELIPDDGGPLIRGEADAAFVILTPETAKVQALLRNPGLKLVNFAAEADAYTARFPSLSKVVLNEGSIDFNPIVPPAAITLLSTSPALLVRKDLHPSLISLLSQAVLHTPKSGFDKDGEPVLFYQPGQYPSIADPEYDTPAETRQIYRTGELSTMLAKATPVAQKLRLPFGVAAFVDTHGAQTALLLIPALTILYPLFRYVPLLYRWSVRRRLLFWYRQLKALEARLDHGAVSTAIASLQEELEHIDGAVRRIRVPLDFTDQFYDLRGHIDFVRRRIEAMGAPLKVAAE